MRWWRLISPCAEHYLDWFHVTMRLTVLGQYAKGLAHHDAEEARRSRTGWSGSSGGSGTATPDEALRRIEDLADDLDALESAYPGLARFATAAAEFTGYIGNNARRSSRTTASAGATASRSRPPSSSPRSTSWSASASPRSSRCSGRRAAPTCCCRPAPAPSTARCARRSAHGTREWPPTTPRPPRRPTLHEHPGVLHALVVDLVNRLEAEARAGRQGRTAEHLVRLDLVILADELGYLPFAQSDRACLFHSISRLDENPDKGFSRD